MGSIKEGIPLRDFHHRFPKRLGAFFLCFALLVGLLPATALAADGDTVYGGDKALTGTSSSPVYAKTDESGNVTTAGASSENCNIKWGGNTLTLNDAYIAKGYPLLPTMIALSRVRPLA